MTRTVRLSAWLLLLLMLLPPVKRMTESSMSAHMLVQYPCLMLAGAGIGMPARWHRVEQIWNELGITGLAGCALTLAVLMVPRVLDLALVDARVEVLKMVALLACGAALRVSWTRAGLLVQAFFLGNVLPMTAVVGILYRDAAVRVCNAYGLEDQQALGQALVQIAIVVAALWLRRVARRLA